MTESVYTASLVDFLQLTSEHDVTALSLLAGLYSENDFAGRPLSNSSAPTVMICGLICTTKA